MVFRKLSEIEISNLKKPDLNSSTFINKYTSTEKLAMHYNVVLQATIDMHDPNKSKITLRSNTAWFTDDLHSAKRETDDETNEIVYPQGNVQGEVCARY